MEDGSSFLPFKRLTNSLKEITKTLFGSHVRFVTQNRPVFRHTAAIVSVPRGTIYLLVWYITLVCRLYKAARIS